MSATVFVDTNVFLYARDASQPTRQPVAAVWLAQLWRERTGRTSIQVLSEYYVNATRKLRPGLPADEAWDDVRALMAWRPQPLDATVIETGRDLERRYRLSWWDSLVVAAAQLQGCALLLSEDLQDGIVLGGVTVRSPFTLHAGEAAAGYATAPSAASPHRPRGRPTRPASPKPR
jgi:predicted nucleic acid-binding protein